MKILVGSATKIDIIQNAILAIHEPNFTYTGKQGMYMTFECEPSGCEDIVCLVKDILKANSELSMVYFSVSLG